MSNEKNKAVERFNPEASAYPRTKSVVQVFESVLTEFSAKTAIIHANGSLSYQQLNEQANQLAHNLLEQGTEVGEMVGIAASRTPEMIIAMLAVLKTGAAYVPLETTWPKERIRFLLESCQVSKLLIHGTELDYLPPTIWQTDLQDEYSYEGYETTNPELAIAAEAPAYVLFTSGSTGQPKGVVVPHRAINRLVINTNYLKINSTDIFLQTGSLTFDASTLDIWGPLLNGASLCLPDRDTLLDGNKLEQCIRDNKVTTMWLTAGLFNQLADTHPTCFAGLRNLLVGGDRLSVPHIRHIQQLHPQLTLINGYGPTENTTFSACYTITDWGEGEIPIGIPIANSRVYILDEQLQPVAIGQTGEICMAGDGLALGYLNDEVLNAEKFVQDPFYPGERMYRSGDLGHWDENGLLHFEGRLDRQVKIRGYRIELGEIENRMLQHELVRQAVVIDQKHNNEEATLCAYYVSDTALSPSEIRQYLSTHLPDYLLPSAFVQLENIPLNANGKVDRAALPAAGQAFSNQPGEAEDLKGKIRQIWQRVLGVSELEDNSNFFEAGGHSLRAMQVAYQVKDELALNCSVSDLFQHPQFNHFVNYLKGAAQSESITIPKLPDQAHYALSHAQKRMWVLSQLEEATTAYHIPLLFRLHGKADAEAFRQSVRQLISRHSSLRTVFRIHEGEPRQFVLETDELPEWFILKQANKAFETSDEKAIRQELAAQQFDLGNGPLLRVIWYAFEEQYNIIAINLHHIISDGWSMQIIARELQHIYSAQIRGEAITLPQVEIQYTDFAAWQNEALSGEKASEHLNWWKTHLEVGESSLPVLNLPSDYPRPAVQQFKGRSLEFGIPEALSNKIKQFAQEQELSYFMLMLANTGLLLSRYAAQEDIIIGSPIAGREQAQLENQIGVFINLLPYRLKHKADESVMQLLQRTKTSTLEAFQHQAYPFDLLVNELELERDLSRSPLFDVCLMFQNFDLASTPTESPRELQFEALESTVEVTKYDLTFIFADEGERFRFNIEYNPDLFQEWRIRQMHEHFLRLMEQWCQNPEMALKDLQLLQSEERENILKAFNQSQVDVPKNASIISEFEHYANKYPQQIALKGEQENYSYAQLCEKVNAVAKHLIAAGLQTEDLVGVNMQRSADMIIVLLAILKAGGAYLPLDPNYPLERLAYLISDAGIKQLISDRELSGYPELIQHKSSHLLHTKPAEKVEFPAIAAQQLAYVIYTSGSTGQPKGVLIEHQQVVNFFYGMDRRIPFEAGRSRLLQVTSMSFDISVLEIFWTLTRGITLCVPEQNEGLAILPDKELRHMDFGLFYFSSGEKTTDKYRLLLEGAKFADQHAFHSVWTPERHFHEFGGIYPNPSITAAALASITKHIRLRSGSVVLPLHNPIRVAEEWSVVDNLSNGRVDLSFASGWVKNDFNAFAPELHETRQAELFSRIETVKKLWRGESIDLTGNGSEHETVRIYPRPIQAELPVWVTAGGSPETFRSAGASGANMLTHLLGQTVSELKERIAIYREARQAAGHQGEGTVSLMLHVCIGDDLEEILNLCRAPFGQYLRSATGLFRNYMITMGRNPDEETFSEADLEALIHHAIERYYNTAALIGTIESCMPLMEQLSEAGVDEIACLTDFGVEEERVLAQLPYLNQFKIHYQQLSEQKKKQRSISEYLHDWQITHLQGTPSLMKLILAEGEAEKKLQQLEVLMLGGEALPEDLALAISQHCSAQLHNMYGPTETTIWSSTHQVTNQDIKIGKPIANTQLYVLDEQLQPLPIGVSGELYIAGSGLARGYLNRPELTEERFIPNPFGAGKMYRTGDVASWLPDGTLHHLGRNDDQLKIRGHRIEPGEIERTILQIEGIRDCAVVAEGDSEKQLVAYLLATQLPNEEQLREAISAKLPAYFIPSRFVLLEQFPLTPNGKTDRRKLSQTKGIQISGSQEVEAPNTEAESVLVRVWQRLLRPNSEQSIGINEHFFRIGGDSIKAIQVSALLAQEGYKLEVRQLFAHPVIRDLAPLLRKLERKTSQEAVQGVYQLTPAQHWFFEHYPHGESHYNHAVLLRFDETLNPDHLQSALQQLFAHHDTLRSTFDKTDQGHWQGNIQPLNSFKLLQHDLRNSEKDALQQYLESAHQSFNLQKGPLFKAELYHVEEAYRLLLVVHHLLIDGISWRILLEDLQTAYSQLLNGNEVKMPQKSDSFISWSELVKNYAQQEEREQAITFWNNMLQKQYAPFPVVHPEGSNTIADLSYEEILLNEAQTKLLLTDAHQAYQTGMNDLLLSALAVALNEWNKDLNGVWLLMEGHGREELDPEADFSRTVGWFTSMYPLWLESQNREIITIIQANKKQLRSIPNKGVDYGILRYEGLLSAPEPPLSLLFNYLGQVDEQEGENKSFGFASEGSGTGFAPASTRPYELEITGMSLNGRLKLSIGYSNKRYPASEIRKLAVAYKNAIETLINHTVGQQNIRYSISDFAAENLQHPALQQDWSESLQNLLDEGQEIEQMYPLSPLQEGMLYHYLSQPESTANVHQLSYQVRGQIDVGKFRQSWNHLLQRHDMLRTRFVYQRMDYPLQVVLKNAALDFTLFDWRNESQFDDKLKDFLTRDTQRGFVPDRDQLLRITLIQQNDEAFTVVWSYHHLILDGWCMGIIMREVLDGYQQLLKGETLQLQKASGYGEFIRFLNKRPLSGPQRFWQNYLEGYEPQAYFQAESTGNYIPASWQFSLSSALKNQLETRARNEGVTLNALLQAAWGILLGKYHYSKDVVFGQVVSGRNPAIPQVDEIIGIFINTIPVRVETDQVVHLSDLLQKLHQQASEQQNHQHDSLNDIRKWIHTEAPLVDHILVFDNFPVTERIAEEGKENSIADVQTFEHTDFNLALTFYPGTGLGVHFEYNASCYSESYIHQLGEHLQFILEQVAENSEQQLSSIRLLRPDEEAKSIQKALSNQKIRQKNYPELLQEAFERYPNNRALQTPDFSYTYEELGRLTSGVQQLIHAQKLPPESVIGVYGHPSAELIPVVLGIWFSGHTYLPLDDRLPDERIAYLLKDSQCSFLVSLSEKEIPNFRIPVCSSRIEACEQVLQNLAIGSQTAYLIYTSGTTGVPKGVAVSHLSMADYLTQFVDLCELTEQDCVLQQASIGFDTSLEEFLPILLQGGSVYPLHHRKELHLLTEAIQSTLPTVLSTSPLVLSYLNQTQDDFARLRLLISGGEALKPSHIDQIPTSISIINSYGPTEATVVITAEKISDRKMISLGKPLKNRHTLVLDRDGQILPVGIRGQLAVSGLCLAQYYLNDKAATSAKFIHPEFAPQERFYLTGDQVLLDQNGNFLFLGRVDAQVKIRGYRIETAEIEQQILALEGISHAHVKVLVDEQGNQALCAFWNGAGDEQQINAKLSTHLPDYMLPNHYLHVANWPLTPSGKLDSRALPKPAWKTTYQEEPETDTEKKLCILWEEVLGNQHIGRNTHFFKAGGHSITAMLLVSRIHKQFDVRLPIQSVFAHPYLYQQALLVDTAEKMAFAEIKAAAKHHHYPLSASQRRMYMLWMLNPQSTAYNMPAFYELKGMDTERFKVAIQQLINRHTVLRTRFEWVEGEAVQIIDSESNFTPTFKQVEQLDSSAHMENFVQAFDLNKETFRMELVQDYEGRQLLLMDQHHIISDAITSEIFLRDFMSAYAGETITPLTLHYHDFALWQQESLQKESFKEQQNYWLKQFEGEIPVLELPYKSMRPANKDFAGALVRGELSKESTLQLKAICETQDSTLFMILLAAFSNLLQRYSGQNELIIGTPVSGRTHAQTQDMAGVFINSLALRVLPDQQLSFSQLLGQCKQSTIEAFARQEYPFDQLVSDLQLDRDMSRNPLFDVLLVLQTTSKQTFPETELQITPIAGQQHQAKFDLTLTVHDDPEKLSFGITYRTALFDAWQIEAMSRHFVRILEWVTEHPDQPLAEMELLNEQEKGELRSLNPPKTDPVHEHSMTRFAAVCDRFAGLPALAFEGNSMTYAELQTEVHELASWLKENFPIEADSRVAICLPTGFLLPIALLAVLQAGAAYVPIDPAYPIQRQTFMLEDSAALCCLDEKLLNQYKNEKRSGTWSSINTDFTGRDQELAYVIYTSGSTGKPKGVMTEHRHLMHYLQWFWDEHQIAEGANASLLLSNVAFDGVNTALFGTLLSGGCLHLASPEFIRKPVELAKRIKEQELSFLKITPPLLHTLVQDDEAFSTLLEAQKLKLIVCGGEKMNEGDVQRLLAHRPDLDIINHYGPTESTIGVLSHKVKAGEEQIPIGKAIHRSRVYVVNEQLHLQARGVYGELLIAGDGVTRGYLNRADLTAERFVNDPFGEGKAYLSGDIVQWTNEGEIRFIGRRDKQIKIRGYRIETGEVESEFKQISGVNDAILLPFNSNGETQLVAYALCDEGMSTSQLREAMAKRVPAYMIPARILIMETFPRTPNGKTDYHALPPPDQSDKQTTIVPPQTHLEQLLAENWQYVLRLPIVGVTANFFESGGDSIKAIQLMSRLRQYGFTFELRELFEYPTIRELAPQLRQQNRQIPQGLFNGKSALTPVQTKLLKHAKNIRHFNMAVMLHSTQKIEVNDLQMVLEKITSHHDMLRLRISHEQIQIGAPHEGDFHIQELSSEGVFSNTEINRLSNEIQHRIDPENGPVSAAGLFQDTRGTHLLLVVHHFAIDGVSWRILLEDLHTGLQAISQGQKIEFPLKTDPFASWTEYLKHKAQSIAFEEEISYWQAVEEQLPLALDCVDDSLNNQLHFELSEQHTHLLLTNAHAAYHTETPDLLLTALAQSIDEETLSITMEGHGRESDGSDLDISRTLGWFTTHYPLILKLKDRSNPLDSLMRVKASLRAVPNKGLGYGLYQIHHSKPENALRKAIFKFNYLGQVEQQSDDQAKSLMLSALPTGTSIDPENEHFDQILLTAIVLNGKLKVSFEYSLALVDATWMEELTRQMQNQLQNLITTCSESKVKQLTPGDFLYQNLKVEDYLLIKNQLPDTLEISNIYPLTPMQEGLLFQSLLAPDSGLYREQTRFKLSGQLDHEAFQQAFEFVLNRFELLRTRFFHAGFDRPLQVVLKETDGKVNYSDLCHLNQQDVHQEIEQRVQDIKTQTQVFGTQCLMELAVFEYEKQHFEVCWTHHHILMDGWCNALVIGDFMQAYQSFTKKQSPILPTTPAFSSYMRWLLKLEQKTAKNYWSELLAGYEQEVRLPLAHAPKGIRKEATFISHLSEKETENFNRFAAANQVTQHQLLELTYGLLLQQYNRTDDLVFGTVVSGRQAPVEGIEQMLGLFINTQAVRLSLEKGDDIGSLLQKLRQQAINSLAFDYFPLAEIQALSPLQHKLVNTLLVFENYPVADRITSEHEPSELSMSDVRISANTNYDLSLVINPGAKLHLEWLYQEDVYEFTNIEKLAKQFNFLLSQIISGTPLADLQLISEAEQRQLLENNTQTKTDYQPEKSLAALFEEQVKINPQRAALAFDEQVLSYQEMNEQVNRMAHALLAKGVRTGDRVALLFDRSIEMYLAIFAVLKTGAAYVPLDPDYPADRLELLLNDCGADVLLTHHNFMREGKKRTVIRFEDTNWTSWPAENPEIKANGDSEAYIIYTSGSTGTPKGTLLRQKSVNRVVRHTNYINFVPEDIVLQLSSYAFDGSVFDIFGALLNGACLRIIRREEMLDVSLLRHAFLNYKTSVTFMTSTLFNLMVDEDPESFRHVRKLAVGGEQLSVHHIRKALAVMGPDKLINGYGPTETCVFALCKVINEVHQDQTLIPIGSPISNTSIYILDRGLKAVPQGMMGELYIGGDGLALGYLNQPEWTAKAFIPNPFIAGESLYKTGDLVQMLPNGELVFLGRIDQQVKIRGFRIEPGEIEQVMLRCGAREALVNTPEDPKGSKRLIAYFVSGNIALAELKTSLHEKLPAYLMPEQLIEVAAIPRNRNGKADVTQLPLPDWNSSADSANLSGAIQQKLAELWESVLGIKPGADDSFFALGGHSLKLMTLLNRIHQDFDIKLSIAELFANDTVAKQEKLLNQPQKKVVFQALSKANEAEWYPLSAAQKRMYLLQQFDLESTAYNIPISLKLKGTFAIERVENALQQLMERHQILRTRFGLLENDPVQYIELSPELPLVYLEANKKDTNELMGQFVQAFKLNEAPLWRCQLIRLNAQEHLLLFDIHHAISDGVSINLLIAEMSQLLNGEVLPIPELQYTDFAVWEQKQFENGQMAVAKSYWMNQFSGEIPVLDLPADFSRPKLKNFEGGQVLIDVAPELSEQLKLFNRVNNCTTFQSLLAVWYVFLWKQSRETDLITGTPVAGRNHAALHDMQGMFVNTLALRQQIRAEMSFQNLLDEVKQLSLSAFEHQNYPFEQLVDELDLPRSQNRNPLFDVLFTVSNTIENSLEVNDLDIEILNQKTPVAKFDLALSIHERPDGLVLEWQYWAALFEQQSVLAFAQRYLEILQQVLGHSDEKLSEITGLTFEELELVSQTFASGEVAHWPFSTITNRFAAQVSQFAELQAIVSSDTQLTYTELDDQSTRLAQALCEKLPAGSVVVSALHRSSSVGLSMLACFKAGMIYLPVDPQAPQERIKFMLNDAKAALILVNADTKNLLDWSVESLNLDENFPFSSEANLPEVTAETPAYLIYTSGSTGQPKGVLVSHGAFMNMIQAQISQFEITSKDNVLAFASPAFDASLSEIMMGLLAGASVNPIPKSAVTNPSDFRNYLNQYQITVATLPPAYLNSLGKQKLDSLRLLITAGEAAQTDDVAFHAGYLRYFNAYGPTETAVCASIYEVKEVEEIELHIPIGKPLPNTAVYVLDDQLKPVGRGIVGELCIGGAGLALSYLNHPKLTAEKFIPNHLSGIGKLYRSGDLVKWNAVGELIYLGRTDRQLKIRSYRIEPGEIEAVLLQNEEIAAAVVGKMKDQSGDDQLVAWLVGEHIQTEKIRRDLAEKLPEYMIPGQFVSLSEIPLTTNGKIDWKALEKQTLISIQSAFEAPQGETEILLAQIWQDVLGHELVGRNDHFFELGGHSLKAVKVSHLVQQITGRLLRLNDLFGAPVLKDLAYVMDHLEQVNDPIIRQSDQDTFLLSSAQERLWISAFASQNEAFNIPLSLRVDGNLDLERLGLAWQRVVEKQESLRTIFIEQDGQAKQRILTLDQLQFSIPCLPYDPKHGVLDEWLTAQIKIFHQQAFKLTAFPLWRIAVLQVEAEVSYLLINMHHIITDGWSMQVITKDWMEAYHQLGFNSSFCFEPLPVRYVDFAHWQQEKSGHNKAARQFWMNKLSGSLPPIKLPDAAPRPEIKTWSGALYHFNPGAELSNQLEGFRNQLGISQFSLFRGLFLCWLFKKTGQTDLLTGTPSAGRDRSELKNIVGYFINTLPLRDQLDWQKSVRENLQQIHSDGIEMLQHQDYPLEQMLIDLNYQRDPSRNPIFDYGITWQNFEGNDQAENNADLRISKIASFNNTAKYDLWLFGEFAPEGYHFIWEYNADLFQQEQMPVFADEFINLCRQVIVQADEMLVSLKNKTQSTNSQPIESDSFDFDF